MDLHRVPLYESHPKVQIFFECKEVNETNMHMYTSRTEKSALTFCYQKEKTSENNNNIYFVRKHLHIYKSN